jgi:hypothetical protein
MNIKGGGNVMKKYQKIYFKQDKGFWHSTLKFLDRALLGLFIFDKNGREKID